jgi:hypothetical protein
MRGREFSPNAISTFLGKKRTLKNAKLPVASFSLNPHHCCLDKTKLRQRMYARLSRMPSSEYLNIHAKLGEASQHIINDTAARDSFVLICAIRDAAMTLVKKRHHDIVNDNRLASPWLHNMVTIYYPGPLCSTCLLRAEFNVFLSADCIFHFLSLQSFAQTEPEKLVLCALPIGI